MKWLFDYGIEKYESGWAGEIRILTYLYFALVINYIYGTRITLTIGIHRFEIGIVLIEWDKFKITYHRYESED